jgi:hypothetical protein
MIQFTKVLAISLVVMSANVAKAAGPFDAFLGAYTVQSATCENGDTYCKEIKEIRVEYLPANSFDPKSRQVLHLTEAEDAGDYVSYPMEEMNNHEDHYTETAEITGDATSATWQHSVVINVVDDYGFMDELRTVSTVGSQVTYASLHREQSHGTGFGNFQRMRSFVLVKKASPQGTTPGLTK